MTWFGFKQSNIPAEAKWRTTNGRPQSEPEWQEPPSQHDPDWWKGYAPDEAKVEALVQEREGNLVSEPPKAITFRPERTLWQRIRDAYRGMLMGWRGEL